MQDVLGAYILFMHLIILIICTVMFIDNKLINHGLTFQIIEKHVVDMSYRLFNHCLCYLFHVRHHRSGNVTL